MEKSNNQEKRNNYKVLDGLKIFFYVLVINLLASIVYTVLLSIISIFYKGTYQELVATPFAQYIGLLIIPIAFFVAFLVFNKNNRINPKTALMPTKKFSVWSVFIVIALVGVTIVAFMPIINMILSALANLGLNTDGGSLYPMNTPARIILGFVAYALLPAFAEELLFRGIIFKGFSRSATPRTVVLFTALMFCLMHGGIQQTLYQFILGLMLGLIMYYTGNIILPMLFHFLNNFMVVLLEITGAYNSFLNGFKQNFVGYIIAFALACAGVGLIVLLLWALKKVNKSDGEHMIVEGGNIIIEEENKKLGFKEFVLSFDFNEKFYFYTSIIIALIIWCMNSF